MKDSQDGQKEVSLPEGESWPNQYAWLPGGVVFGWGRRKVANVNGKKV